MNIRITDPKTGKEGLVRQSEARLVCNCARFAKTQPGRIRFCGHIAEVVRREFDARDLDGTRHSVGREVYVPMYEVPGLEVLVNLSSEDDYGIQAARIPIATGNVHLGFVGAGQGRLTLRRFILEWLYIAWEKMPVCMAPHHTHYSWSQTHSLTELAQISYESVAMDRRIHCDTYDLYTTNWCRNCHQNSGVPEL